MNEIQSSLQPGYTQFYDNDEPGLAAGTYEISVTQALPNTATGQFSQTYTQTFVAEAPQFTLDSTEVHSLFPADNANGDFSQILPNILLENPKLPWERTLTGSPGIPWLALLVFKTDEMRVNPDTNSPIITGPVAEFLAPEDGVVKPSINIASLPATLLESSMNSIRIGTDVFQAVTPRLIELASLAHVREVNPEHQSVGATGADPWYSVVFSNRFPNSTNLTDSAGAVNFVHLVSFEGLSQYLVDDPQWPEGATEVQLASLVAWRFVSILQTGQTFADLAENLITSTNGDPAQLLLRIPIVSDGSTAATRIQEGYTALGYHTLPGPDTFAWYRGPFSPVPAQPLPTSIVAYLHPSQAEIYDQANAIFDQSYGSAWTIGRLIALSDPDFINSIQAVRARVLMQGRRLLERSKMPHLASLSLSELAAPGATRRSFARAVGDGMGARLSEMLRQPAPAAQNLSLPGGRRQQRHANHLFPGEAVPDNPAAELQWFLAQPKIGSFLTEAVAGDLDALATWIARLMLLYNVPFNHLVPDQRMLPVESVRFFYVDPGWLTVCAEAAMTIGVHGTRDRQVNDLVAPEIKRQALLKVPELRRQLLHKRALPEPLPQMPAAGLLLRSELVSGWPGLQVQGTAAGVTVAALRMDLLAPNVLIVLWQDVPDTVTISQPQQALAFGAENGVIALRSLATSNLGQQLGTTFPASGNISEFFRISTGFIGENVLQLVPATTGAPGYLIPGLQTALNLPQLLTPAQFAIEMVNAPEQITFNPPLA